MALFNKLFFPTATAETSASPTPSSSSSSSSTTPISISASVKSVSNSRTSSSLTNNNKRHSSSQTVHSKNYLSQFPFDGEQVRVLLYRECDSQGRRLLFDSNALQKVLLKETNGNTTKTEKITRSDEKISASSSSSSSYVNRKCSSTNNGEDGEERQQKRKYQQNNSKKNNAVGFIEVNDEYGYKHTRPKSTDITGIGEMVFGASAMSFRGTAFKVHWLKAPARILCSQVFLSPVSSANGQSPQSTISINSFMTPRHSISSEYGGSVDGVSLNSFSMPITVGSVGCNAGLTPSACSSLITTSVDVPDHISVSNNSHSSDSIRDINAPRYSSTYSTATDSGYSGISRIVGSNLCSDQWSSSYQFSTRSSLISESSEQFESIRKLSTDSSYGPISSTSLMDQFSSDGSLQRRITRNINTSFENKNSMNDIIGFVSDNYPSGASNGGGGSEGSVAIGRRVNNCTNIESNSNPEIGRRRDGTLKSTNRRAKLGLAVCILLSESFEEEMEVFCSEHMALLESMLSRMRAYTERAYIYHKDFLQIMCHAWEMTQKWINDLFSAPRIKCPIWLSITTSGSKYSKNVAERFIKELCWLLSLADTKDTNFFVSTMLTAVLTYHLGWVSTVSASSHSLDSTRSDSASAIEQRAKLLEVSQKHPYNALWAQMGDLYGAVGMPPKLTRTVIYGTEKLSVERLLNILTYFIRCGEVRRSSKREDFNKEQITNALQQNKKESYKKSNKCQLKKECVNSSVNSLLKSTLKRTQTCNQNLNTITDNCETDTDTDTDSEEEGNEEEDDDEGDDDEQLQNQDIIGTMKKNEIPNVFAFRDSRFVQQELRIGNYLMDTGILKSSLLKSQSKSLNSGDMHGGKQKIRLTVTSPENEKTRLLEVGFNESIKKTLEAGAVEAIEIGSDVVACTTPHSEQEPNYTNNLFHNLKDTLKRQLDTQRHSSFTSQEESGSNDTLVETKKPLDNLMSQLSLSDLITQNSMGKGERMTWGIEPIKEAISSEERIHFDVCHQTNKERQNKENFRENASDVVFVLGDNEPLVNIKRSTEDLSQAEDRRLNKTKYSSQHQSLCPLHQRTHSQLSTMLTKKHHSGVKFNFKTYPQIATNYMKNKNLVISNTEDTFIIEKSKQNDANLVLDVFPPTSDMPHASTSNDVACLATTCVTCVVCSSILNSYQTPSNATELDSETDKEHGYSVTGNRTTQNSCVLHTVNSATSVNTLKSLSNENIEDAALACQSRLVQQELNTSKRRNTYTGNSRKQHSQRGSTSSVATKCAALSEAIKLLKLPVPGIKELPQEDESYGGDMKLRAGFIPSLFLNVSDHYISDMVLQGTFASPKQWEINLREDLALAAHSASLISLPVENVAIVADMEKWDVRLISSQTQCFPYAGGQSAPVGMSQLVSSMLETVQAMNSSGIGAYECLAFLESKLKEIYLQSETLAVFLLATDFCPLAAVTSALNLSENDVPLLLSVASIHTPQISKKCGISFR